MPAAELDRQASTPTVIAHEPMARYPYPHTIDNGAGERLTFARLVPNAAGGRLEGETVVKPGAGPPMRIHHYSAEVFTVQEGRIGYQRLGEAAQFAGAGETVAFPPGEAHPPRGSTNE